MAGAAAARAGAGWSLARWRSEAGAAGLPRAHFDALCRGLGVGAAALYADDLQPPTRAQRHGLRRALRLAAAGCPPDLVCGEAEFMGHLVRVGPGQALLPREDSRALVRAVAGLPLPARARVAELGLGSGALCLALRGLRPDWRLLGLDISARALATARANLPPQPGGVALVRGNWAAALRPGSLDGVLSNPPYVETAWLRAHPQLRFEPALALDGGGDGLDAFRALLPGACAALRPGGWLALEHGRGQGGALRALLPDGMEHTDSRADGAGLARVLLARRQGRRGRDG